MPSSIDAVACTQTYRQSKVASAATSAANRGTQAHTWASNPRKESSMHRDNIQCSYVCSTHTRPREDCLHSNASSGRAIHKWGTGPSYGRALKPNSEAIKTTSPTVKQVIIQYAQMRSMHTWAQEQPA